MFQKFSLFSILWIITFQLSAQIDESFDDDLSSWSGDLVDFVINTEGQLQLNAAEAGQSILFQETHIPDSCVWNIDIQLNFAPSGSNQVRCFLQATDATLNTGYAVQWGASGDADAIEFVKYDNGMSTILGSLMEGAVAGDPSIASIEVKRTDTEWLIQAAYSLGGPFTDSLIIQDPTFQPAQNQIFALECTYTSTRTDRFLFDNIRLNRSQPDISSPKIMETRWKLDTLVVTFNEAILPAFAEANWIEGPNGAIFVSRGTFANELHLSWTDDLVFGNNYTIQISGVEDFSGNVIEPADIRFVFDPILGPEPFELLISEIMAAPSEATALPNVEYIEWINRSQRNIQLQGLQFTDGSRTATLPEFELEAGAYVVLCALADSNALKDFGPLIPLDNFPTLNNGGDDLKILNSEGGLIHAVFYSDSWYGDPSKDDGGWSLELIDTSLACLRSDAYRASNDSRGGSPGTANLHNVGQVPRPDILELDILAPEQLIIHFDQWMSAEISSIPEILILDPFISIDLVRIPEAQPNQMEVILSAPLESGIRYSLDLSPELKTCTQKPLGIPLNAIVGIPEAPDSGQLVISEIMFDPFSGGAQWVEIYNPTEKIFSWKDLYLSFRAPDLSDQVPIIGEDLILPGRYYVLTEDRTHVLNQYSVPYPTQIREQELPGLDRNDGRIRLERITNTESKIIEEVCYDEDWHSGFTRETKGVSLERLNMYLNPCTKDNWQSAAETKGFATPTGKNSQQLDPMPESRETFSLLSPSFSPDGDGFEDQMVFSFTNTAAEAPPQLDLFVYSLEGILVKTLANNLAVGQEDQILWDGTNEDGLLMTEGYYLIKARTYSDSGRVDQWQATVYLIYPD